MDKPNANKRLLAFILYAIIYNVRSMEKEKNVYYLFWIFIIGCIVGYVVEGIFSLIKWKEFINHSAVVIGPFNAAYGLGALLLSAILYKLKDDKIWKIFIIGFVGGSILEYIMSLGMELVLGFTAWDYSIKPLNINGRICARYSLFWGALGVIWIKYIYPWLIKFIDKMDYKVGKKIAIWLSIFLFFDVILTGVAIKRAKQKEKGIEAKYKYEEILDKTFNKEYLKNMYNDSWSD